jgi:hypothetical protein
MLEFPEDNGVTIVTLECAGNARIFLRLAPIVKTNLSDCLTLGVLPTGTAVEVVQHIEKAWARGQAAVEALRAELGVEDRDTLCPLVEGGVSLHKIYGVMHDTCNTANLVAQLMIKLQERKHRAYLTDEVFFIYFIPDFNPTSNYTLSQTRSGNWVVRQVKLALISFAETILETCP